MDRFPLQIELIDAFVGFANATLKSPEDVLRYFNETWTPTSLPKLRACRKIQSDVRSWFPVSAGQIFNAGFAMAIYGIADSGTEIGKVVDPGIRLAGQATYNPKIDLKTGIVSEHVIEWRWDVTDASLRAICGLAAATIYQEDLHKRVGFCARAGCGNMFIDRASRGIRRIYCKTRECELIRNRERVAASRGGGSK